MTHTTGSVKDSDNSCLRKADVAVESLIPGLEAPLPQRLVSQSESVASNRTDSLTGEDSLLDCSLLSNPAADLLDEFAPVAFAAQPHKGNLALLPLAGADLKLLLLRAAVLIPGCPPELGCSLLTW
uniref:Progesterone receptor n=1 Tax=Ficedula albicollis TaxID=59894 RepID=A0A803VMB0_FICAL